MAIKTKNAVIKYLQEKKAKEELSSQINLQADERIIRSISTQLLKNDWTIGDGGTDFFTINGSISENRRIYGAAPNGEKSILWECVPDTQYDADGGWNTVEFKIDRTKKYRFSVFMKTSSNTGNSYLGCQMNKVCNINTTTKHTNPYFFTGDLPTNNEWHLIVGYVYPAGSTGNVETEGGVYNCITGQKTRTLIGYNWADDAETCIHRCYLYYNETPETRQWMYNPRVDLVDGNEPSIMELLGKETPQIVGIDGFVNRRVENKFGGVNAINNIIEGKKANGSFNTAAEIGAETPQGAQEKVNLRLSDAEKNNLLEEKTLQGKLIYHVSNKPTASDIGGMGPYLQENVTKSLSGELSVAGNVISGAKLTDTITTNEDIDGVIVSKFGSDTAINNIKNGMKADGNYISPVNIGLGNVENKSLAEIKSEVRKFTGVQLIENDWTLGYGATPFFAINGGSTENHRVLETNPMGEKAVIWECRPSSASSLYDGGWNTQECDIDKDKTYRFSVFVKRNNTYGKTYFGCQGNRVCSLNTTTKYSNPYFWDGDLPATNKWYLLIGFVFPAGKTGLATTGGIYDCTTGAKAANITRSFNWASDALKSYHRCYHSYNTNTFSRQWMYNPRLDLVDGNEPSIMALIGKVHAVDVKYGNGTTSVEDEISSLDTRVSGVEGSSTN